MLRYIFLSVFALLLLTACGDGSTDQEGAQETVTDTSSKDLNKAFENKTGSLGYGETEPTPTTAPFPTPVNSPASTDILVVPVKVHLLTDMPMKIWNDSGDDFCEGCGLMDSWITKNQIEHEIMPEVNRIWEDANIHWDVKDVIVESAAKRRYDKAADWLSLSDRDDDTDVRISKYFDLIPASTVDQDMVNLYFFTFTGNTRQGRANSCSYYYHGFPSLPTVSGLNASPFDMKSPNKACHLTVVGQWSNKYLDDYAAPEKRVLLAPEGTPSLAMTVAHELGHSLRLWHPEDSSLEFEDGVPNLMIGSTSGHRLTDEQIKRARKYANNDHIIKP
jgi:hypothetical protein